MSLVSLQSKPNQDKPYLFGTYFPQPIIIKPDTQVCVLKFLHYRNNTIYSVTSSNNLLKFIIGDVRFDAIRDVYLTEGDYTGDELATELATQLNATIQQFNYTFTTTFTRGDITVSPPTDDSFTISYASVALPAAESGGIFRGSKLTSVVTGTGYATDTLADYGNTGINDSGNAIVGTRGLITSLGTWTMEGMAFASGAWDGATVIPGFSEYAYGIVRDSLSKFDTGNVNLDFTYRQGTCGIKFDSQGFEVFSITGAGNTKLGNPGYVTYRKCRRFAATTLDEEITDANDSARRRYKFTFTFIGDGDTATPVTKQEGHKFILQCFTSGDYGVTYSAVPDDAFGIDAQSNSYVKSATIGNQLYEGIIWISDDPEMNDLEGGTTQAIANRLQTKFAPFRPFIENYGATTGEFMQFVLSDETWTGGTITKYAGTHTTVYQYEISDGVTTGYMQRTSPLDWNISSTDTAAPTPDGSAILDLTTTPFELVWTKGDLSVATLTSTTIGSTGEPVDFKIGGRYNSAENPVSISLRGSDDDILAHKTFYDDENSGFNLTGAPSGTLTVGDDLSKQCSFLLSQLTRGDIQANSGLPLRLKANSKSGTVGQTLGSLDRVLVNTSSTGQQVFISTTKPKKISKDATLHISVPELSGVKSYEGGYNGIGKSIAQIPREEIVQNEDNGTLTYVAPFENWIDINNTQELAINNFTTEVRFPDGSLADDLQPNTTLQIKFREDPDKLKQKQAELQTEKMLEVMRLKVSNTGS